MPKSTGSQMGHLFHSNSPHGVTGGVPKFKLSKLFSTLAQTPNFRASLGQLLEPELELDPVPEPDLELEPELDPESDPELEPDPPEGGHFDGGGGGGGAQEETKVKKRMLSIRKRTIDIAFEAISRPKCSSRYGFGCGNCLVQVQPGLARWSV
ncbi:hypothetical protein NE237_013337 [Protea cynaroides]|uniref:Uncharacterized protein n=1 Tax=Protea cynaroides TaxID=273540 RepID=A0A9Q0JXR8_9MAGN|nr:hypothetical protein NE237_013337 [Protea cynaroides]